MSDLQKIDQHTQFKLTNTIQKAATLALASQKDPSQILAQQLKSADIPKQLTKIATHAFNRRLSVTKLASCQDDTKAQDFALADTQRVCDLVGVSKIKKSASLNQLPFKFSISKPTLNKAASTTSIPYKNQLTIQQGLNKLSRFIDQSTRNITELSYSLDAQKCSLQNLKKKAMAQLQNNQKLCKQLTTQYGQAFTSLFSDLPQTHLHKYAAYTIIKKSSATQLVQKAIQLQDSINIKEATLKKVASNMDLICTEAAALQKQIHQKRINGLIKMADGWSIGKQMLAHSMLNPFITAGNVALAQAKGASDIAGSISDLASQRIAVDPSSVLTAQMLADDKFYDGSLVLTAALAHPSTKNFPTRQVQRAVNDALVAHPEYRSPRYFQHMIADVKQRLISGGQTNVANLAAIQQLIKRTAQSDKILRQDTPQSIVSELQPQTSKVKDKPIQAIAKKLKEIKQLKYIADGNLITQTKDNIKQLITPIKQRHQAQAAAKDAVAKSRISNIVQQLQMSKKVVKLIANNIAKYNKGQFNGKSFDAISNPRTRAKILARAQNDAAALLPPGGSYKDLATSLGLHNTNKV